MYRSGIIIGRGSFLLRPSADHSLGEHIFTLLQGTTDGVNPWLPGRAARPWMEIDPNSDDPGMTPQELGKQLRLAPDFADKLYALATPGTTVVVTDEPALRNFALNIITTD